MKICLRYAQISHNPKLVTTIKYVTNQKISESNLNLRSCHNFPQIEISNNRKFHQHKTSFPFHNYLSTRVSQLIEFNQRPFTAIETERPPIFITRLHKIVQHRLNNELSRSGESPPLEKHRRRLRCACAHLTELSIRRAEYFIRIFIMHDVDATCSQHFDVSARFLCATATMEMKY